MYLHYFLVRSMQGDLPTRVHISMNVGQVAEVWGVPTSARHQSPLGK